MLKKVWLKPESDYINNHLVFKAKLENCEHPVLHLAAENIFSVFAFDSFVSFGPARAAHGYTRKEIIDLSDFVRKNTLIVSVEVSANHACNFFTANDSPFFAAEIYDGNKIIASTDDFKAYRDATRVVKTQRYSYQRHFTESYRNLSLKNSFLMGETGGYEAVDVVEVEGNEIIERRVNQPKYQTSFAKSVKKGFVCTDDSLPVFSDRSLDEVGNAIQGYKHEELDDCLSDTASKFCYFSQPQTASVGKYEMFDFKANITGFLVVDIDVKEDLELYCLWDEILVENKLNFSRMDTCNVIRWSLTPGSYRLQSAEPYTMRYLNAVMLSGKGSVKRVGIVRYENPDVQNISFACADAELTEIFEAARNTFAQNAVDLLTDCPSRERAGWLCDSYFSSRAEQLLTGNNLVEENFLQNYVMSKQDKDLPDGMIPMCYPSDNPGKSYIPNWAMWFVIELLDYKKRNGNTELIKQAEPKIKGLINYFESFENEYGLLENLEGWVFLEWSKSNEFISGVNFPSNMLYCGMLSAAAELLNDSALAEKSERLKRVIEEWSFNGAFYIDQALRDDQNRLYVTQNLTETCQYYAFYFGIATLETHRELFDILIEKFGADRDFKTVYPEVYPSNAFIGNFLRLDYLCKVNYAPEAVLQCKDYFLYMAKRTATLWEHNQAYASCNHGFASLVCNFIVHGLTGFIRVENGKALFTNRYLGIDCEICVPLKVGSISVSVKNGNRCIKTDVDMEIVFEDID